MRNILPMEIEHDYLFKIILIGDSGVGKTSLMKRYTDHVFTKSGSSTIGVDFKIKTVTLNSKKIKLQIWDTAGQERFRAIVAHYYRGAHGIFLVFDVTNKDSFEHLKDWMSELEKRDVSKSTEIIILGNKIDNKESIAVNNEEVIEFLNSQGIPKENFFEVSALDDINVEECFMNITKKLVEKNVGSTSKMSSKVPFKITGESKSSSCC